MRRVLTPDEQRSEVERNVRAYAKAWRKYERKHGEIFNPLEQERLRETLSHAVGAIENDHSGHPHGLDLGCGTGNVTSHLLELGLEVTAADVSPEFLRLVESRFPAAQTLRLSGVDLGGVEDESFDIVAAYSVLHHVPDYLRILDEIVRVLRPGGVVYVDHEASPEFWRQDGCLAAFKRALREEIESRPDFWNPDRKRWQKFLIPSKYVSWFMWRYRQDLIFCVEGDIHTWPHDHIEWDLVERRLADAGCELVTRQDYLVYRPEYPREVYDAHRDRCSDMRTLAMRKRRA